MGLMGVFQTSRLVIRPASDTPPNSFQMVLLKQRGTKHSDLHLLGPWCVWMEDIQYLGTGVTNGCELPYRLQEQKFRPSAIIASALNLSHPSNSLWLLGKKMLVLWGRGQINGVCFLSPSFHLYKDAGTLQLSGKVMAGLCHCHCTAHIWVLETSPRPYLF